MAGSLASMGSGISIPTSYSREELNSRVGTHALIDRVNVPRAPQNIATHAPMLLRVPGLTDGGIKSYHPTETVDLYPTLVDFAIGHILPTCPPNSTAVLACTEGTSLRPLIAQPDAPLKLAAFSVYNRGVPHFPPGDEEEDELSTPSPSGCLDLAGRGKGCAMGYSMLTRVDFSLVRYTEWVHFPGPSASWQPVWNESFGTELYNHRC